MNVFKIELLINQPYFVNSKFAIDSSESSLNTQDQTFAILFECLGIFIGLVSHFTISSNSQLKH